MDLNFDNNPEQIKQLIGMLQKMLPKEDTNIPDEQKDDEFVNDKIKTKTRKLKDGHINKFDSMPEMSMHKRDTIIDKKLSIYPPSPRTRKFEPISVKCRSCGKEESVNPNIIPDSVDRYKCNKCSAEGG